MEESSGMSMAENDELVAKDLMVVTRSEAMLHCKREQLQVLRAGRFRASLGPTEALSQK